MTEEEEKKATFSQHKSKRKKSKSAPKNLIGVIGETHSDSIIEPTNGTKIDTIKSLRNQLNYNNNIVEKTKAEKEELISTFRGFA